MVDFNVPRFLNVAPLCLQNAGHIYNILLRFPLARVAPFCKTRVWLRYFYNITSYINARSRETLVMKWKVRVVLQQITQPRLTDKRR